MDTAEEVALLERMHQLLAETHAQFGVQIDPLDVFTMNPDYEVHRLGRTGVLAFLGDYVLTAWPDDEQRPAARDAYRIIYARLRERGRTLHMVHPRNYRSVKLTRRLGAKPRGLDADGFVHYECTLADFERHVPALRRARRGQEIAAA